MHKLELIWMEFPWQLSRLYAADELPVANFSPIDNFY